MDRLDRYRIVISDTNTLDVYSPNANTIFLLVDGERAAMNITSIATSNNLFVAIRKIDPVDECFGEDDL